MGQGQIKLGHSYRLASGTWAKAKLSWGTVTDYHLGHGAGQAQSWGTVQLQFSYSSVTVSAMLHTKLGHSTVSVRLASGIWDMGYGVQHSFSQIIYHTAVSAKPSCKFCIPSYMNGSYQLLRRYLAVLNGATSLVS